MFQPEQSNPLQTLIFSGKFLDVLFDYACVTVFLIIATIARRIIRARMKAQPGP